MTVEPQSYRISQNPADGPHILNSRGEIMGVLAPDSRLQAFADAWSLIPAWIRHWTRIRMPELAALLDALAEENNDDGN